MNNIFLENEKKTSRQILYINWAACSLGYFLVLLSKIFGFARITYFSLLFCFGISMLMLVFAEVLYYFIVKNKNSKITLKYFIIFITCIALSLILYTEGNPYVIGIFFYGLIAAALYYDAKLFLFSCGLTFLLLFILVSNNYIDVHYRVNSMTFLVDLFRSSIISVVLLGEFLRKSKRIITTIKNQEEELGRLNLSLESKNKTLKESNEELEKAYGELASAQTKLIQQEKMVSLGMLVAGVVHEINTPLGVINCNIDLSKTLLNFIKSNHLETNNEKLIDTIGKIDKANEMSEVACKRISDIVKKLREFSRLDEGEVKYVNINNSVDNTIGVLNSKLNNRIEIIKNYGNIPEIECYPDQISELFFNILINAIDAIKQSGIIWIDTESKDNKVYIRIKDNGIGVKEDQIKRIFDPGFTTKGVGVGTGLGLAIAYNIVETHKGKISVSSEYGKGTEFLIELPQRLQK